MYHGYICTQTGVTEHRNQFLHNQKQGGHAVSCNSKIGNMPPPPNHPLIDAQSPMVKELKTKLNRYLVRNALNRDLFDDATQKRSVRFTVKKNPVDSRLSTFKWQYIMAMAGLPSPPITRSIQSTPQLFNGVVETRRTCPAGDPTATICVAQPAGCSTNLPSKHRNSSISACSARTPAAEEGRSARWSSRTQVCVRPPTRAKTARAGSVKQNGGFTPAWSVSE